MKFPDIILAISLFSISCYAEDLTRLHSDQSELCNTFHLRNSFEAGFQTNASFSFTGSEWINLEYFEYIAGLWHTVRDLDNDGIDDHLIIDDFVGEHRESTVIYILDEQRYKNLMLKHEIHDGHNMIDEMRPTLNELANYSVPSKFSLQCNTSTCATSESENVGVDIGGSKILVNTNWVSLNIFKYKSKNYILMNLKESNFRNIVAIFETSNKGKLNQLCSFRKKL